VDTSNPSNTIREGLRGNIEPPAGVAVATKTKSFVQQAASALPDDVGRFVGKTETSTKSLHDAINELFRQKKFFLKEEELMWNSMSANVICSNLRISDDEMVRRNWWNQKQKEIRKKVDAKRTSISTAIKEKLTGKLLRCCNCIMFALCGFSNSLFFI
jgi:hypothetical protein